ncbi:MAG TPA: FAD:protein FMN transferase [Candidatus Avoscillospira stercorigallinarum]|uniref:FAD:protein FMN transferase n=1 Tax=Candidatus Avoscillospira stercorigallinarum TaxID=2840708 RepID=A0A9D0Z4S7_9FIRM|nr:FAD:protein FMN transferase [Candidatus Avoscillospira stercorigallinarum]
MKRLLWLVGALLLLSGCGTEMQRYEATYWDVFDTVTTVTGYAAGQAEFDAAAREIHDALLEYHRLYNIYESYDGLRNLKTVNDQAGIGPVPVDTRILSLLQFAQTAWTETGGRVNAAMGSVLALWHDAREQALEDPDRAALPDRSALEAAALHTDLSALELDLEAGTAFLTDPDTALDVGALAKGYAVEQVAAAAPDHFLISVGGNVCATGPKPDGTPWTVAVENPDGGDFLKLLYAEDRSVVTSGDYQRYFELDGVRYHHIIDPDTLEPAAYWRSVTVVAESSAAADCLSTALFTLPQAEGQRLLDQWGAEALWIGRDGAQVMSPGFSAYLAS